MKKLVLKLLRLAKKDGDYVARDVLDYIKKTEMQYKPMLCTGQSYNWTYFKWDCLVVHYNGQTDVIEVFYNEGKRHWTLCE